jgi:hypothetical protein
MLSIQETLASWATILGAVLSVFSLIQSRAWLTGIGVLLIGVSVATGLYARRERLAIRSASVVIESKSIDALNMANLKRRVNTSLVIQEARHEARIDGEDLSVVWQYTGYCQADQETAIEFSIDSESAAPFDQLECLAYDLGRDPNKTHSIRPMLIGPDGISKKIAVPFLEPLTAHQSFNVIVECFLPGCMKAQIGYYTSTLSFAQARVRRSTVRLIFIGECPDWVRVYECLATGSPTLLRNLRPSIQGPDFTEYLDTAGDVEPRSARIYVFGRR